VFKTPSKYFVRIFVATVLVLAPFIPAVAISGIAYADTNCSPNGSFLSGSSWLSGNGVNVCNNGGNANNDYGASCVAVSGAAGGSGCPSGTVYAAEEWQCVELVNRLYLTRGWINSTWWGNGNTLINNVPKGLIAENNGSISYVNPGDVITLDDGGYGHAAIINSVDSNGTIHIINQNTTQSNLNSSAYIDSGSLSGKNAHYHMNAWSGYTVQAIIHAPAQNGGGGNSTTPKVTPVQYNTEMDVFKRGGDNAIWGDTIQAGSNSWGGWHSLGGGLASNPSADQYGTEMDVFATNSAGQLWQKTYQPSSGWGGWTLRASNMAGDPASIAYNGNLYVFSRGTDGNLYVTYWNGSSWVGPNRIAGNGSTAMGSSPTVTIFGSEMDVYMRGVDSNLWKSGTTDGVNFGSLGSMGGGDLENDPKAITYDGEMDVYANTTSGTLVHDTYTTTNGWSGFNPLLGASFVGSPTALQYGSGEMDVYDRGISDSYIYQDTWQAGGVSWGGWTSRGGNEAGDPTVLEWTPDSEMDVYATNYAGNTDKDTWQPSLNSWSGFTSLL
jgi:hypothetical protein